MRKSFKRKGIAVAAVLTALILVAGLICKPVSVRASDVNVYTSYNYLPVGSYDSADTAILQSVDTEERTVTFYNTTAARNYTLNYDGTTYVSDRYGTPMSIEQLTEGTIVRVHGAMSPLHGMISAGSIPRLRSVTGRMPLRKAFRSSRRESRLI